MADALGECGEQHGDPISAHVFLTPCDFGIPKRKRPFSPTELGHFLACDAKTVVRMIEDGILRALPLREGTYRIPYIEIANFFMRQQGVMN